MIAGIAVAAGFAGASFLAVLCLDVLLGAAFVVRHALRRGVSRRRMSLRAAATRLISGELPPEAPEAGLARRYPRLLIEEYARMTDNVRLSDDQRGRLTRLLADLRVDVYLVRDLHARDPLVRSRAASLLPLVPTKTARVALIDALEREERVSVRLFMTAALAEIGESFAIPTMIDTLARAPERYQRSVWGLLFELGDDLAALLPVLMTRREKEIQLMLINFAGRHRSSTMIEYLNARVNDWNPDVSQEAFRVLCDAYPSSVDHARYLAHDDKLIRSLAAEALGAHPTPRSLALLFEHLDDTLIRKSIVLGITKILRARPELFRTVMRRCLEERSEQAHARLVEVLSGYVDYLMERLVSVDAPTISRVLEEIVRHGRVQEVVNFLNRNTDEAIQERALAVLRGLLAEPSRSAPGAGLPLADQLGRSLDAALQSALGLSALSAPGNAPARREHPNLPLLHLFLGLGAALVPAACVAFAVFLPHGQGSVAARFLGAFNSVFTIYSAALNGVYLLLLCFSVVGVLRQSAQSGFLRLSFLFKQHVLPSISIITPAYNEEGSIVESVRSLLTLRYPDFEVIVVNDGSRDGTLAKLVEAFTLERVHLFEHSLLRTQEVRGFYANKRYPELLVVDKVNGGKADSLNAGINVARKEYFAGIDADSMLERDALLNMAGLFLHSDEEVVAAGGNIFPVNGCTVRRGALLATRIPRAPIARFQTIEYLRAFMAGRVGWATIRTLLIISGAFGVFHRRKVVAAHGYLTRSEHYMKDTVGEDMELVVRLTKGLRESGARFSVQYAHNANCWTEIPERFSVLNRQRDRWQRGLLDIVTFHRRMILNPVYGRMGMVGFPYFVLFEILGPWFEAEGYLALAASLALGAIALPAFLLLFTAAVLLGILVSITSMIIAEHGREYFPFRDKVILLLYSILENFGFRQLMSLLRVRGFLRMLARVGGWGQMERKGLR